MKKKESGMKYLIDKTIVLIGVHYQIPYLLTLPLQLTQDGVPFATPFRRPTLLLVTFQLIIALFFGQKKNKKRLFLTNKLS